MRRNENGFATILMYILMVFLAIGLAILVFFNYEANTQQMEEIRAAEEAAAATPTPEPTATPEPTPVPERNTETVTLAFAGDIVGQAGLTTDAEVKTESTDEDGEPTETVSYDYSQELAGASSAIAEADFAACTLVGTLSKDNNYEAYHMAADMASAIAGTGFQIVNAATDRILDYGVSGLTETVTTLNEQGLAVVGANASDLSGLFIADVGELKVACLSYTYGTGGYSVVNEPWCVSLLTTDYMTDQAEVDYERIDADIAAVKEAGADVVVCFVYWWDNAQYYTAPRDAQLETVDHLLESGVDILIGGGIKVPQPMELRTVERADGSKANCVVCYSLSNLMSCFNDNYTDLSAVAKVEVSRDVDTGEVWVSGLSYEPLFMLDTDDHEGYSEPAYKYRLLDAREAMEGYETAPDSSVLTEAAYEAVKTGTADLQTLLGAEYDSANGGVSVGYPY